MRKGKRDGECFPMLRGFHEGLGRQHQPCMAVQVCSRFPHTAMEFHRYSIPTCIPIETQRAWETIALSCCKETEPASDPHSRRFPQGPDDRACERLLPHATRSSSRGKLVVRKATRIARIRRPMRTIRWYFLKDDMALSLSGMPIQSRATWNRTEADRRRGFSERLRRGRVEVPRPW